MAEVKQKIKQTKKRRANSVSSIYSKKFDTIKWHTKEYEQVFADVESSGCWLIWGGEKNGKTRFALMLANELTKTGRRVLYISAEEGISKSFVENCRISGLETKNRLLQFENYIEYNEIELRLKKRNSPDVVFLDNATVYDDEITKSKFKSLLKANKHKIFILIAHEERNEPYTAIARLCRKLANVVIYVEGLMCRVSARVPGGTLVIDDDKASLYHGETINEINNKNKE